MSHIDFNINAPMLQGEPGKGLNKAVQREQLAALFDLRPVMPEGEETPGAAVGETFKVVLKQYDGNSSLTVTGGYAMFPEHLQIGLGDIFAELKHLGMIASFTLDMSGWSLVLTANGLGYFDTGRKSLKKGSVSLKKLPSNTGILLLALADSDDPAELLRERFEICSYYEDQELRGMIRELVSEGYIRIPIWKEDIPQYVEIDDAARVYREREDESPLLIGHNPNISLIQNELDSVQEVRPMKLSATVYVSNSLEAVPFYMEAFGLTLGFHAMNADGTYWHAVLERDGVEIFSVSESHNEALAAVMLAATPEAHPTIGIGLHFDSEDEVRKAYDMLKNGGNILYPISAVPWSPCSAELIDRYGVDWCIYVPGES